MDLTRFRRLSDELQKNNIDYLVTTSYESLLYLIGFDSANQKLNRSAQLYVVLNAKEHELWYVLPVADLPSAGEAEIELDHVIPYGNFFFNYNKDDQLAEGVRLARSKAKNDAVSSLEYILSSCIGHEKRIGIEMSNLQANAIEQLKNKISDKTFIAADDVLTNVMAVKDADEIRKLACASELTEKAYSVVTSVLKPGISEFEALQIYRQEIIKCGAENTFAVITFGKRSAFVDTSASETNILREGDVIRFDLGCCYQGYHSDMARTAVMGKPSSKLSDAYKAILEGEQKGLEALKVGVPLSEIFHIAVKSTQQAGLPDYNRHHCGHSIGLKPSGAPLINQNTKTPICEGMTLCVETPYYQIGWGGVQVEDTVVITDKGYKKLTLSNPDLLVL